MKEFKCSKCKIILTTTNGYFCNDGTKLSSHYCRVCHKEKSRAWRKKGLESSKNSRLKSVYKISLDDYKNMFAEQSGVCRICKKQQTKGRFLCVDHCHKTLKVRGLLCDTCNWMLGNAKDDISILAEAIQYLSNSK